MSLAVNTYAHLVMPDDLVWHDKAWDRVHTVVKHNDGKLITVTLILEIKESILLREKDIVSIIRPVSRWMISYYTDIDYADLRLTN